MKKCQHARTRFLSLSVLVAAVCAGPSLGIPAALAQEELVAPDPGEAIPEEEPPAPAAAQSTEIEVLTRGPLHEALAAQTSQDPTPGVIAPRQPPEAVEELPPDVKPEGDNIVWVPGYWHWDEERADFIWISGLWRNAPLDRRWVPGYWTEGEDGHQWVSGFWAPAVAAQLEYLPEPPATLEAGPSSPAPSEQHFWTPGSWTYSSTQYLWQPGYWQPGGADWVWVPSYYTWTPSGCIYVPGYRDYLFSVRGTAFSPIYIPYGRYPRYRYTPYVTIDLPTAFLHLFIRPRQSHFYFGNYYAGYYRNYYPWYNFQRVGRSYDPFYCNLNWRHHHDGIDYLGRLNNWHSHFAAHQDQRPGITLQDQQRQLARHSNLQHRDQLALARPLEDAVKAPKPGSRFVHVEQRERTELSQRVTDLKSISSQRATVDAETRAARATARQNRVRPTDEKAVLGKTDPVTPPNGNPAGRRGPGGTPLGAVAGQGPSGQDSLKKPEVGATGKSKTELDAQTAGRSRHLVLHPDRAVKASRDATNPLKTLGSQSGRIQRDVNSGVTDRQNVATPGANNPAAGTLGEATPKTRRDRNIPALGNTEPGNTGPGKTGAGKIGAGIGKGRANNQDSPANQVNKRPRVTMPQAGTNDVPTEGALGAKNSGRPERNQALRNQALDGNPGARPGNGASGAQPKTLGGVTTEGPRRPDRSRAAAGLSGPSLTPGGPGRPLGARIVDGPPPGAGNPSRAPRIQPVTPRVGGATSPPGSGRPRLAPGNLGGQGPSMRTQPAAPLAPRNLGPPAAPRNLAPRIQPAPQPRLNAGGAAGVGGGATPGGGGRGHNRRGG